MLLASRSSTGALRNLKTETGLPGQYPKSAAPNAIERVAFGPFVLDRATQTLTGEDGPIHIGRNAHKVIDHLVAADGSLVPKDDLILAVWQKTAVSDSALSSTIKELRRALGDDARDPVYIENVYGRGYRLLVPTVACLPSASLRSDPFAAGLPIGREHWLQTASRALGPASTVAVVGLPGSGRSRLAQAIGASSRFSRPGAGHKIAIDLAECPEIPEASSLQTDQNSSQMQDAAPRPPLIMIENLHLGQGDAAAALAQLRSHFPEAAILYTAPHPVGAPAETVLRVPPLGEDAAVALLLEDPAYAGVSGGDREAVRLAACAQRLGGLPALLRSASPFVARFGAQGLLDLPTQEFLDLPIEGTPTRPDCRSIRDLVELALHNLGGAERDALYALAVFPAEFPRELALAALADPASTTAQPERLLDSLVARSLAATVAGNTKMLSLSAPHREYLRVDKRGEAPRNRAAVRAGERLTHELSDLWERYCGTALSDAEFEQEFGGTRHAARSILDILVASGEISLAAQLLFRGVHLWRGREEDIVPLAARLERALPKDAPPAAHMHLAVAATVLSMATEPDRAEEPAQQALHVLQDRNDLLWPHCYTLAALANAWTLAGKTDHAADAAAQLKEMVPRGGPSRGAAVALSVESFLAFKVGELERARHLGQSAALMLISFKAQGMARVWQATMLKNTPIGDLDDRIKRWELLLGQIGDGELGAKRTRYIAVTSLIEALLERAGETDVASAQAYVRGFAPELAIGDEVQVSGLLIGMAHRAKEPALAAIALGFNRIMQFHAFGAEDPQAHAPAKALAQKSLGYLGYVQALEEGASLTLSQILDRFGENPAAAGAGETRPRL